LGKKGKNFRKKEKSSENWCVNQELVRQKMPDERSKKPLRNLNMSDGTRGRGKRKVAQRRRLMDGPKVVMDALR